MPDTHRSMWLERAAEVFLGDVRLYRDMGMEGLDGWEDALVEDE